MYFRITLLLSLISIPILAKEKTTPPLILECKGKSNCLIMSLDLNPKAKRDKVVVTYQSIGKDIDNEVLVHLKVKGQLSSKDKTKLAPMILSYRGPRDEVGHTHVGALIHGGVLGFNSKGNPILNSSAGPVVVDKNYLIAGCAHCLTVESNNSKKVDKFNSDDPCYPSWNNLLRLGVDGRVYLYFKKKDRCMQITNNKLFRAVPLSKCQKANGISSGRVHEGNPEADTKSFLEIPNSPFKLRLNWDFGICMN